MTGWSRPAHLAARRSPIHWGRPHERTLFGAGRGMTWVGLLLAAFLWIGLRPTRRLRPHLLVVLATALALLVASLSLGSG